MKRGMSEYPEGTLLCIEFKKRLWWIRFKHDHYEESSDVKTIGSTRNLDWVYADEYRNEVEDYVLDVDVTIRKCIMPHGYQSPLWKVLNGQQV